MPLFQQLDLIKLLRPSEFELIHSPNYDFSIPETWSVVAIVENGLILSSNNILIFTKFNNVFKIKSSSPPIEGEYNG